MACAAVQRISTIRLLLESTLMSQCRHNAMAPRCETQIAGPLERLTVKPARHNKVGASPRPFLVWSDLYSCGTRLAPCASPSPSSSRVSSAYKIRPASYHPEGF